VVEPGDGVEPLPGGVGVDGVGTEPDGFGAVPVGLALGVGVGVGVVLGVVVDCDGVAGAGVVVGVEGVVFDGAGVAGGVDELPPGGVVPVPVPGAAAGGGVLAFTISATDVFCFMTLS
jgi:hypothetical protein